MLIVLYGIALALLDYAIAIGFANSPNEAEIYAWPHELKFTQESYGQWIEMRLGHGSRAIFDFFSDLLFSNANFWVDDVVERKQLSPSASAVVGFHFGLLRLAFIVAVWWRLWVIIGAVGLFIGIRSSRIHRGKDLLGISSSGQLFDGGIHLNQGDPKDPVSIALIPALASFPTTGPIEARYSSIGKWLVAERACSALLIDLLGMLLSRKNFDAFPAAPGESDLVRRYIRPATAERFTASLLERTLSIVRGTNNSVAASTTDSRITSTLPAPQQPHATSFERDHQPGVVADEVSYVQDIFSGLQQIVGSVAFQQFTQLGEHQLLTLILSVQVGKTFATYYQAGTPSFDGRIARQTSWAVLRSLPGFAELSDTQRTLLRRAIAADGVGFDPTGRDEPHGMESIVMWNLVELLTVAPHDFHWRCQQLELAQLAREAGTRWHTKLLGYIMTLDRSEATAEKSNEIYASRDAVCLALPLVVRLFEESLDATVLNRIGTLLANMADGALIRTAGISTAQSDMAFSNENADEGRLLRDIYVDQTPTALTVWSRIHALSAHQQRELQVRFGIATLLVAKWSICRAILLACDLLSQGIRQHRMPLDSVIALSEGGIRVQAFSPSDAQKEKSSANGPLRGAPFSAIRSIWIARQLGEAWYERVATIPESKLTSETEGGVVKRVRGRASRTVADPSMSRSTPSAVGEGQG